MIDLPHIYGHFNYGRGACGEKVGRRGGEEERRRRGGGVRGRRVGGEAKGG